MALFHELKMIKRGHAPGFRGFAGLTTSMRKHRVTRASNNLVAVQTIMLDQNGDEVDSLKIFKEHPWIFAYNGIICCY